MLSGVRFAPFYFAHPELFLIPFEHLGPAGMTGEFAAELERRSLAPKSFDSSACGLPSLNAMVSSRHFARPSSAV